MKKKVISAALAGTLAVSLLSACGASNEPQNISDVSSAASSEATSTTASSESTGDAAQELTFVLSNIPDGLDEKEREEFARLKVIKRVTTKQK